MVALRLSDRGRVVGSPARPGREVAKRRTTARLPATVDAPTLAVAAAAYGGWLAATAWHARLPDALLVVVGGWLVAWHGSLQHETIHGRPFASRKMNAVVASWPLSLWLPYGRYRDLHLAHHGTPHTTCPEHDPESRYLPRTLPRRAPSWSGRLREGAARLQASLAGRLLFGPAIEIGAFLAAEARRLARGERETWRAWALHAVQTAAVLAWLHACGLGLVRYGLCFVLPGAALTLLRSYAEHRADPDPRRRAAVVEAGAAFGLLFMNNNLHALHHARPDLPWWRLPQVYAREREALLEANGGLVYRGYGEVAARFWRRPHDVLVHPGPAPDAAGRA